MNKEYRKLSELKNWEKNPRSIKDKDFERLKKQITNLGQYKPLLITSDGTVLGGNMRLRAYKSLGIEDLWVSVVVADTEAKKLEYALSDNDRAGFYDDDLLANLIPEYPDFEWSDYSVDLREPESLQDIIDRFTPVEEDEVPEVSEGEPESKLGEVYQLGRHRLMCRDATRIEDVEKLMDGQKADMVFTDPPYNLSFNGGTRKEKFDTLINDDISIEDWDTFIDASLANILLFCKGAVYVCIDWRNYSVVFPKMEKLWKIYNCIVWVKNQLSMGMRYRFRHEFIIYADNTDWQGEHSLTDVWDENKDAYKEYKHPTQKPISLVARAIKNSSKQDDIVLDLFGGSGSTLIACEQTNRTCYMMELSPVYCDVIRKRYENLTKPKEVV